MALWLCCEHAARLWAQKKVKLNTALINAIKLSVRYLTRCRGENCLQSIFNQINNIYNFNVNLSKIKYTLARHLTFKRQIRTPHHSRIMLCCSSASWLHGELLPANLRSAPIRGNKDSQGKDGCCQYCRDCWKPQRSSGHERGSYTDAHKRENEPSISKQLKAEFQCHSWTFKDLPCMNQPIMRCIKVS